MISRPDWLRFRLRTLLLAMLVIGAGLGWWFRPFKIERRWPNGKMQYELHVRRAWNGTLHTNGQQRWWWGNGRLARDGISFGQALPRTYESLALEDEQCWHTDGAPMHGSIFAAIWLVWTIELPDEKEVNWSQYRFAETEHDP